MSTQAERKTAAAVMGSQRSPAKTAAAQANARLGGRRPTYVDPAVWQLATARALDEGRTIHSVIAHLLYSYATTPR